MHHPSYPAMAGNIAENSDSCADNADGDSSSAGHPTCRNINWAEEAGSIQTKGTTNAANNDENAIERVINVKNCTYLRYEGCCSGGKGELHL